MKRRRVILRSPSKDNDLGKTVGPLEDFNLCPLFGEMGYRHVRRFLLDVLYSLHTGHDSRVKDIVLVV